MKRLIFLASSFFAIQAQGAYEWGPELSARVDEVQRRMIGILNPPRGGQRVDLLSLGEMEQERQRALVDGLKEGQFSIAEFNQIIETILFSRDSDMNLVQDLVRVLNDTPTPYLTLMNFKFREFFKDAKAFAGSIDWNYRNMHRQKHKQEYLTAQASRFQSLKKKYPAQLSEMDKVFFKRLIFEHYSIKTPTLVQRWNLSGPAAFALEYIGQIVFLTEPEFVNQIAQRAVEIGYNLGSSQLDANNANEILVVLGDNVAKSEASATALAHFYSIYLRGTGLMKHQVEGLEEKMAQAYAAASGEEKMAIREILGVITPGAKPVPPADFVPFNLTVCGSLLL